MKFEDKYPEVSRPYLASFVILRKGNKVAMVLRKNTDYMDGYYGLPAGKVDWGEPFKVAAVREAKEEAGVTIELEDIYHRHTVHRHGEDVVSGKFMDWIDIYFEAEKWEGEPHNAEEHKSEELVWISLDQISKVKIVPPQKNALERIANGERYSQYGW